MPPNKQPYTEGPFAGVVSPLGSLEDLTQTSSDDLIQRFADLQIEVPPFRKPLSDVKFQKLIEARVLHSAALRCPPISGKTPELVETDGPVRRSGILEDVFLGARHTAKELESSASIRDRMNADDRFVELGELISTFFSEAAMALVEHFMKTQPDEMQGLLCETLVRDIIQEIPPSAVYNSFIYEGEVEGRTIRAAMTILVDKDDVYGDDTTLFRDLMLRLELCSRKHGLDYTLEW